MPIANGRMSFKDMQDEVIAFRFKEAQRGSISRWINQRYAWVWAAAEWPFKFINQFDLNVSAGSQVATYNAENALRWFNVYNENGDELDYMVPREFYRWYSDTTVTAEPSNWTVVNGVVQLGPTPLTDKVFTANYESKVSHFGGGGARDVGLMDDDTDYPVWDAAYHYMLVMGATATGLKLVNDPTWEALEDEFRAIVTVMEQELLPADRGENAQFGSQGEIFATP